MDWIDRSTRILFFTGKGGVGKTSLACATALVLAYRGKRVLLVSTDPASNLDEVLGTPLSSKPTPVANAARLWALNLDPEEEAREYRRRVVDPYRGVLPDAAVASMEEQLSGACTTEIAAFDKFSELLGDAKATSEFDHVVFDTAPTGHTLRLLRLPAAWTGFIAASTSGTSCLGPLAGLQKQSALYQASVAALGDAKLTTLILVARPEASALAEAERSRAELGEVGLRNQVLAVNAVFEPIDADDAIARALQVRGRQALSAMPSGLAALPCVQIPLRAYSPMGVDFLRAMLAPVANDAPEPSSERPALKGASLSLSDLVDEIVRGGPGVVMTMGKGGVGKTTVAAAVAAELARRGLPVHLTTTDPAAHVAAALGDGAAGVKMSRIDPEAETRAYTAEVIASSGKALDAQGLALLEEDLRSPCTEEIAVFRAFARAVGVGKDSFVVIDTAPTGHTLLLLDATEAYHREVLRTASDMPEDVKRLLPRLRDPRFTRVLIVTLPEATPVHEAAALQADLSRAGIKPFAWVVNQSFLLTGTRDALLRSKGEREAALISEVERLHGDKVVLIPWMSEAPSGRERLLALASGGARAI